jgi:hypothetical protein
MKTIKIILLLILLFLNFDLLSEEKIWGFEINKESEKTNFSSYVFSNDYNEFFSIYCTEEDNEVYFLVNLEKKLLKKEKNLVKVYFDNDRSKEYDLFVNYNEDSIFFLKSSFYIEYNNHYNFDNFLNNIKKNKTITFMFQSDNNYRLQFKLNNSFNALNSLKKVCSI